MSNASASNLMLHQWRLGTDIKEQVECNWHATTRLKKLKVAKIKFISDGANTLVDGFIAHESF